MTPIILLIAIILLVGLAPAAATFGFCAIGLAALSQALRWRETSPEASPDTVEEITDEVPMGMQDFNKSLTDFVRKVRQRLLSMQEV